MIFPINNNYLCEDYINYLKEYNKKKTYKYIKLDINKYNENFITLEKDVNFKKLNFFGLPFSIQKKNTNITHKKELIEALKKFITKEKIDEINLLLIKKNLTFEYLDNLNKKNISKIAIQKIIDLDFDIKKIKSQFSKGHKYLVNKKFLELTYKIIDYTNYNNEIFEMMKLHEYVSGKLTRSKETWALNEKMIINKKAFLVSVCFEEKIISYSFFYCNNNYSEYFSSCTIRNYFKKFNNLTHKSVFLAIEYLKKRKFKYFTLGETKNLYDENSLSIKEKNIQRFKNSFGGISLIKIFFKDIDENIINICEEI